MKTINVLELFGGIGAPRKALERLGFDFKIVDYVDFDKKVVEVYNTLYDESYKPTDITKYSYKGKEQIDLLFSGSPCTDFSIAGKGAGGEKDSGTRSSLLWETIRIIKETKPKIVIWENVKGLIGKKHIEVFKKYCATMNDLDYINTGEILNAKDFGIPQNRERIFVISILNSENPVDIFESLKKVKMQNVKDFLEDKVPYKYYIKNGTKGDPFVPICNGRVKTVNVKIKDFMNTITTKMGPGNGHRNATLLAVEIPEWKEYSNFIVLPRAKDGKVINGAYNRFWKIKDYLPTISVSNRTKVIVGIQDKDLPVFVIDNKLFHLRTLTERECWRLMGFTDKDFDKVKHLKSTQLYHTAGNSIVVNVLEAIFKELYGKEK